MEQFYRFNSAANLQSGDTTVTTKSVNKEIDHLQLANWLKAVAEKRDKQAFTNLFKFFAPKIQRIAVSKFTNESQAAEIVQETMTNVWRKSHLYNSCKGAPTTWVFTIMRNVTFDMFRKQKSNKEDTLSDDIWPLIEPESNDDEPFKDHLENEQINSLLNVLPENQQQVVKGFYFLEMSQEQLARHLNLPLGTVKSRLRLALTKLKISIGEQND